MFINQTFLTSEFCAEVLCPSPGACLRRLFLATVCRSFYSVVLAWFPSIWPALAKRKDSVSVIYRLSGKDFSLLGKAPFRGGANAVSEKAVRDVILRRD